MSGRRFEVPVDTRHRQRKASDPAVSAWVAANAGSGKTWVLSRRVMRILLAGTPASRILCLTFTKAAAATMSNRVFQELARWTVAPDDVLADELRDVIGREPTGDEMDRARRLFAAAIETPGGLKIQTIHGFCERILQQFPLEADLSGNFEILDDATASDLVAAARGHVLVTAAAEPPDGRLARALAAALEAAGDGGLVSALDALVARRTALRAAIADAEALPPGALAEATAAALGVAPGDTLAAAEAEIGASPDFAGPFLSTLIDALRVSGSNDRDTAERLYGGVQHADPAVRIAAWREAFFTDGGEGKARKIGGFATKAILARFPDLPDRFDREVARLEAIEERCKALRARAASAALLALGEAMIQHYELAKRARGALDFEDLIGRTVALLSRSDAAQWVQYKLDRGIDHILVDEAQDTSPEQWAIVRRLSEEFFAGEGARAGTRTVFAVGDEKQSIYSFQNAAPREFAENQSHFGRKAEAARAAFASVSLHLSFRSTPDVLAAVDKVFAMPGMASGVADGWQRHAAARASEPGLVEIWPPVEPVKLEEPEDWTAPVDSLRQEAPPLRLARRIAAEIERLLAPGFRLEGTGGRVKPKDVLVLVRKRGPFVDAMNRVLKEARIPVAGADRLVLTDHIAVEDLIALGRVMLLSADDLSLAAVLKSPLFGWDDDALYAVAAGRPPKTTLFDALADKAGTDEAARAAHDRLNRWRARADLVPPFEFYAGILSADGGRRRFLERLGPEADDILDEFLARALAHGDQETPSLAGFLATLEAAPPEIKREMDETRDEVRVMTVHGAKGLEAPVVFLVDGGGKPTSNGHEPKVLPLAVPGSPHAAPVLVWCPSKRAKCRAIADALADWQREAEEEYRRLLYVAMTRAADRLYVVAHAGANGRLDDACWYRAVERALGEEAAEIRDAEGAVVARRWTAAPRDPVEGAVSGDDAPPPAIEWPRWMSEPAAAPETAVPLRPSMALREIAEKEGLPAYPAVNAFEAALAPESAEMRRGRVVHKLLETLPDMAPAERRTVALDFVRRIMADLGDAAAAAVVAEVLAVLDDPRFAAAFAPGSRAEVAIVGEVVAEGGRRLAVSGQIDRLAVTAEEVLVVDFKTNRDPPAADTPAPEGYVAQMAIYRRLLADLFPGRRIRAAILWTARPSLAEIPADALDAALAKLTISRG